MFFFCMRLRGMWRDGTTRQEKKRKTGEEVSDVVVVVVVVRSSHVYMDGRCDRSR